MKKYSICRLLAGLIVLTGSCTHKPIMLQLQSVKYLPRFPSASAIEYSNNRIYLFGDDAPYMVVLDTAFNIRDTIRYSFDTVYRVPKEQKADLESAVIMHYNGIPSVVAFGSLSTSSRQTAYAFPLHAPHRFTSFSLDALKQALKNSNDLNVEGAASVADKLVFANRAHLQSPVNQLFVVDTSQHLHQVMLVTLPKQDSAGVIGISGLYYNISADRLFFTASEEATVSTYTDGAIGNSYLGWLDGFSMRMQQQTIKADGLIPLHTIDRRFLGQKIEGLCAIETNGHRTTLVLVCDNDDGKSTLFKMNMYQAD